MPTALRDSGAARPDTRPIGPESGRPQAPSRTLVSLLGLVQATLIAAITLVTVALPAIGAELGADDGGLVLVTSAYGVAFGGLLLLGGAITDRHGHRRVLLAGLALFGGASALAGLAGGLWVLVGARFAAGAGAALVAPAALGLVRAHLPEPARRARVMALWGVVSGVGATGGMALSGVATASAGWRWGFAVPVAVAFVAGVGVRRLARVETPGRRDGGVDWRGAGLATAGLAALIGGLRHSAPLALVGLGLLALFWHAERGAPVPLLDRALLARARLPLAAVALTAGVMATAYFLLALRLQRIEAHSPLETAAIFALPAPAALAAGPVAARLLTRLGAARVLAAGLAMAACGAALLAAHAPAPAALPPFAFGAGVAFSGATVLVLAGVAEDGAGRAGAVFNSALEVGPPVMVAALVALASARAPDAVGGDWVALAAGAAALLATALLVIRRSPSTRR